jgi:PPOX class probable F420-dependent enzyme
MPPAPVSPEIAEFLSRPHPAVVATLRSGGAPHSAVTWYDWEDGRVLLNMDEIRLRVRFLRRDPRLSLTVFDADDWYRHVTLMGRVVSLEEDVGLEDYQRLARRYQRPPGSLDRERVSAWIEVEQWYAWNAARDTPR